MAVAMVLVIGFLLVAIFLICIESEVTKTNIHLEKILEVLNNLKNKG